MTLHFLLKTFQLIVSMLLILLIMVQNRTSGLSSASGNSQTVSTTKRGAEKFMYRLTVVVAILFVGSSLAFIFVR